jgi:hypothetical protein
MNVSSLGNTLYRLIVTARQSLFNQGEFAQLTYNAFDVVATNITKSESDAIEISIPVGYRPDRTPILSRSKYTKEQLLGRYHYLAFLQLPLNGLTQLVTITESLIGDVIRAVVVRYPQKLGAKRTIQLQSVLEAESLEEVHLRATDSLLNDLSYKSPLELALVLNDLLSINPVECPAFHKYVELKATRDIHVHNRGWVNETYLKKAGSHARAGNKAALPVDNQYFLESYEACLQLTEWLEKELDQHWHSSDREAAKDRPAEVSVEPQAINEPTLHATTEKAPPAPKARLSKRRKNRDA